VILVDTSALFALIDADDRNHGRAVTFWRHADDLDLVSHGYVVSEAISLTRVRHGWSGVERLLDELLPRLRTAMVDAELHDEGLAAYRADRGGTSFVDRVTIAFARRHGIREAFAFDPNLVAAGLRFPGKETA